MLQSAARINHRVTPLQRQDRLRETIRDWLQSIMDRHSVRSMRQLALTSGVSPATVNRAMDTEGDFVMSTSIIAKIAAAYGEAPPASLLDPATPAARPVGLSENDGISFAGALPSMEGKPADNRGRWRLATETLTLLGYFPGDVLEFDFAKQPRAGDVVVAQVYAGSGAQTVIRQFQPPYLVVRSQNPAVDARPLLVDNERVVIRGPLVLMARRPD